MSGNVDDIINAAPDPVKAVLVSAGSIAGKVGARVNIHVGVEESLMVAVDGSSNGRPGPLDRQDAFDCVTFDLLARLRVQDDRLNAKEWQSCGARFGTMCAW